MIAEYRKRLFEVVLLDVAMGRQVSTGGTAGDQVFAGQKGQGTGVVGIGKMDLSEPERIGVAVFSVQIVRIEGGITGAGSGLTGQGEDFVANVDGRIELAAIQCVLPPVAQEPVHVCSAASVFSERGNEVEEVLAATVSQKHEGGATEVAA